MSGTSLNLFAWLLGSGFHQSDHKAGQTGKAFGSPSTSSRAAVFESNPFNHC